MSKIETMSKEHVTEIGHQVVEELQAYAEERGLLIERAGGSYDPGVGTFTLKLSIRLPGSEQKEWERWAELYDLPVDGFGREFSNGAERFRIAGFNPKAKRMPVIAEKLSDGRTYKFATAAVKRALTAEQG